MEKNKIIIGVIILILAVVGLFWIAASSRSQNNAEKPLTKSSGILTVLESNNYDFGTISMAAGKVNYIFKIKNTGSEAVNIGKMYTSCMCTTATLMKGSEKFGPYGMPGHGLVPKINQKVDPNEEVSVEVIFDPAAHGPAGIGRIERIITLENNAGLPIELLFAATVTP